MSPRAAWRLETLGFDEVYDYVAGKEDWFGAGWPSEGKAANVTRVATLADPDVPTCALDEKVGEVRARLGPDDVCLVVNEHRVVLGLVDGERLDVDDARPVGDVMQEGPSTIRPNVPAAALAEHLEHGSSSSSALITTSEGELVGLLRASQLEAWAEDQGQTEVNHAQHGDDQK